MKFSNSVLRFDDSFYKKYQILTFYNVGMILVVQWHLNAFGYESGDLQRFEKPLNT